MTLSAAPSAKNNIEQARVLRLRELEDGFQSLSNEIRYHPDATKAPPSLYSKTKHNAYLLELFTDGLDSGTPLQDTLATGLVMSIPFHESLALFVGYTFKGDESFDKHGPVTGFEGMRAEDIKMSPMRHPRLKCWLINKSTVTLKNMSLAKTVRTTTWVDVSLHKATLHASDGITVQTLDQCALAGNDFIEYFMRRTLTKICHPTAMVEAPGERDGFMLPSTAETIGYILQEVLKNPEEPQPSGLALCPLSGLTLQSRENFHQSLNSMTRTIHRSATDCKAMLVDEEDVPISSDEKTAFAAYARELRQLFKKYLPQLRLADLFPVFNLTILAKILPDGAQKTGLSSYLNSPVENLRLVEMRRDTTQSEPTIKLAMVNMTAPTVYLVDKANDTDMDVSDFALDDKKFKQNLLFDNAADALDGCSDLNSVEGDAHNPYQVQSGLGLTAQQWLEALRGV